MSPFWVELLKDLAATALLFGLVAALIMFWRYPPCPR
jgi:hypothetical protein